MRSISRAGVAGGSVDALRRLVIVSRPNVIRLLGLTLGAAALAACAQSNVVHRQSAFAPSSRQASIERRPEAQRLSVVRRRDPPSNNSLASKIFAPKPASGGIASYYSEGKSTASGEKFDPNELTAAHPSLPFGTRLRVTNTTTGKSVTVRVNDRGPYVPGRVVDVSYSAAQALGMVRSGTANVKLDVVQ
jgi:peptidoglycan lytic transglycosylase